MINTFYNGALINDILLAHQELLQRRLIQDFKQNLEVLIRRSWKIIHPDIMYRYINNAKLVDVIRIIRGIDIVSEEDKKKILQFCIKCAENTGEGEKEKIKERSRELLGIEV